VTGAAFRLNRRVGFGVKDTGSLPDHENESLVVDFAWCLLLGGRVQAADGLDGDGKLRG